MTDLHQATAKPVLYLLTGSIRICAINNNKVLTFFCSVLRYDNAIERDVVCRQLALKVLNSNSWTTQVRELLYLYKLLSALNLVLNTPRKSIWKKMVKKAIHHYWIKKLRQKACIKRPFNTSIKPSAILEQSIQCGDVEPTHSGGNGYNKSNAILD